MSNIKQYYIEKNINDKETIFEDISNNIIVAKINLIKSYKVNFKGLDEGDYDKIISFYTYKTHIINEIDNNLAFNTYLEAKEYVNKTLKLINYYELENKLKVLL